MKNELKGVKIPRPGQPVRGSQTGQPIMVLFDLIGRRWSMGILWNLSGQTRTFRDLQAWLSGSSGDLEYRLSGTVNVDMPFVRPFRFSEEGSIPLGLEP